MRITIQPPDAPGVEAACYPRPAALARCAADRSWGMLSGEHRAAVAARTLPLIVPVSSELQWTDADELPADDTIAALVRSAVGYQLDIRL